MSGPTIALPDLGIARAAAEVAGLRVCAMASWPETGADEQVTPLAGFIVSTFSPLVAHVAERALRRRPGRESPPAVAPDAQPDPGPISAVVLVSGLGDVTSAAGVAAAVDTGAWVRQLLFFQSVPNAVAGYLAARWRLTGPVVCVGDIRTGLDVAALLIDDGDADEALVVWADVAVTAADRDLAAAVVVAPEARP